MINALLRQPQSESFRKMGLIWYKFNLFCKKKKRPFFLFFIYKMTCSKIFSGDLTEVTNEIIQYFHRDYYTLHSCVLVNRLWCRLAIPLLWEDPFSNPSRNNHFIKLYLHNLNEEDKIKLNEHGINNKLFPSNTLFNYPSFI